MNVRAQVSMVFHLDKCIGCHTCSIACKNVWTDRKGTEYMWWNNVETKPGTGYPTLWEDQDRYRGGWERNGKGLKLRLQGKGRTLVNLFANPSMPTVDDYYEPWTYRYEELFNAPEGDDQPTARPVSLITGEPMEIEAGPNWDDDLSGSKLYADADPNLDALTDAERADLKRASDYLNSLKSLQGRFLQIDGSDLNTQYGGSTPPTGFSNDPPGSLPIDPYLKWSSMAA